MADPALAALADLLVRQQRLGAMHGRDQNAQPPVSVKATPPPLPPFQQPGSSMPAFDMDTTPRPSSPAATPPAAQTPPAFTPQAPGQVPPPGGIVDAQTQANTQIPPMPDPVNIGGAAPGSVRSDLMSSIIAAIKNGTVNGQPPAWAANFGNLTDQQKT